jgi:predicted phage terminase large subunit-like protein
MTFSPEQHAAMSLRAHHDFYHFTRWMFLMRRNYKWSRALHHKQIADALMRVYRGECKRLIINIPPRYSKTEIAVINFIAWTMGRHPDSEYIHASYSAMLAGNNSSQIRTLVQHEDYRAIFPGVELATEAAHHWKTTAGGVMYATGTGGTITGFGAGKQRDGWGGCIVIDDAHKADEARSEVMRQNVIDWFQNTLESRKNSRETPIIVIMQRLHEGDLSGWLLNGGNGEKWEHLCLPAIQPDGSPLWPEKHSLAELRVMEQASPYVFAGQYMQRPAPLDGGIFKPGQIQIIDALPAERVTWVRGWDFAATLDGDYTAGGLLGRLPDGRFVIGDMVRLRALADERDNALVNTSALDGKSVKISLPQDPGQAGKTQILYLSRKLSGYRIHTSPETGDKITRAEPFAAQINVGNVLMLRGGWNSALIDEMRMFPNGSNDDQVDALSRAFSELITPIRLSVSQAAITKAAAR